MGWSTDWLNLYITHLDQGVHDSIRGSNGLLGAAECRQHDGHRADRQLLRSAVRLQLLRGCRGLPEHPLPAGPVEVPLRAGRLDDRAEACEPSRARVGRPIATSRESDFLFAFNAHLTFQVNTGGGGFLGWGGSDGTSYEFTERRFGLDSIW